MRRIALAGLLGCCGCVAEWNGSDSGLQVSGDPPSLQSFRKLNQDTAGLATLARGPDGAPWTMFCEWRGAGGLRVAGNACKRMHLVRLDGAPGDEQITGDGLIVRLKALYVVHDLPEGATPPTMRTITIHRPGEPAADDVTFQATPGKALYYIDDGGDDDVFVYWVLDPATTQFDVFRRDQRYHRTIPIPAGVDPTRPQDAKGFEFLLTSDGSALPLQAPDGHLTVYSTLDGSSVDLGDRCALTAMDDPRKAMITVCADQGMHSLSLDGATDRVLDPATVDPATLVLDGDRAYYVRGGDLWSVPLDGSAPPAVAATNAARYLDSGPGGEIVVSRDPADRYAGGAGDGWIGDWNFMERGRKMRWGGDGGHLYFLEHAATLGIVGDLTSVEVPGGAPLTLGLNVHMFDLLPDGRILAVENRVYAGTWNRLVVIDERAMTKRWVVPSATEFFLVPGAQSVVADVVSGASGYDIVQAPVP